MGTDLCLLDVSCTLVQRSAIHSGCYTKTNCCRLVHCPRRTNLQLSLAYINTFGHLVEQIISYRGWKTTPTTGFSLSGERRLVTDSNRPLYGGFHSVRMVLTI